LEPSWHFAGIWGRLQRLGRNTPLAPEKCYDHSAQCQVESRRRQDIPQNSLTECARLCDFRGFRRERLVIEEIFSATVKMAAQAVWWTGKLSQDSGF